MPQKAMCTTLPSPNGRGPRLRHLAYWVPTPLADHSFVATVATTGDLANLERGSGRHGISNAFFLHRSLPRWASPEVYSCDYQTIGPDHEPIRWNLRDLAGRRCGSAGAALCLRKAPSLPASEPRPALFEANVVVADLSPAAGCALRVVRPPGAEQQHRIDR